MIDEIEALKRENKELLQQLSRLDAELSGHVNQAAAQARVFKVLRIIKDVDAQRVKPSQATRAIIKLFGGACEN